MSERINPKIRSLTSALFAALLTGCAQQQIPFQADSYNKALADFGGNQILLNILRATKRKPMYFANIGNYTAKDAVGANVKASLPIVDWAVGTPSISPSLDFNSGMSSISIQNLNTQKFQRGILTAVKPTTLQLFDDNGWRPEILLNMMTRKIHLTRESMLKLLQAKESNCASTKRFQTTCDSITNLENQIEDKCEAERTEVFDRDFWTSTGRKDMTFVNHGGRLCSVMTYQNIVRYLIVAGARGERTYKELKGGGLEISSTSASESFKFTMSMRSPQNIIYYLGELVRRDIHEKDGYLVKLVDEATRSEIVMFDVRDGLGLGPDDISATDGAQSIHISAPNYDDTQAHRSFQIITLVKQLIDLQIDSKDIPLPNTLIVSGG